MTQKIQIRPGYACINLAVKKSFKTFRLAAAENKQEEKISQVIWHNIRLFREIVEYNITHNIYVYRVSSDLVPFCTHPYVKKLYQEHVQENEEMQRHFKTIRDLKEKHQLRLSIHPSQFNVLSSPKSDVVKRSIEEINTQTEWIKAVDGANVVIHVGGAYDSKSEALKRFKAHLGYVDKKLISIENDDKTYNAQEVCSLCEKLGVKWVYDYHHDRCHPSSVEVAELIKGYAPDKYHLSTGKSKPDDVSHADYVSKDDYQHFTAFLESCGITKADVIFEAKKKDLAIPEILIPDTEGYWIPQALEV